MNDDIDLGDSSEPEGFDWVHHNAKRWVQGVLRRRRFPAWERRHPPSRRLCALRTDRGSAARGPRRRGPVGRLLRPGSRVSH